MSRRFLPFFTLVFILTIANADSPNRPYGLNCDINSPPENSGEVGFMEIKSMIFPRVSEMDKPYTGCQNVWFLENNEWIRVLVLQIDRNRPIRLWSPDGGSEDFIICSSITLISENKFQKCEALKNFPIKSYPPGCYDKLIESVENKTNRPKYCVED